MLCSFYISKNLLRLRSTFIFSEDWFVNSLCRPIGTVYLGVIYVSVSVCVNVSHGMKCREDFYNKIIFY